MVAVGYGAGIRNFYKWSVVLSVLKWWKSQCTMVKQQTVQCSDTVFLLTFDWRNKFQRLPRTMWTYELTALYIYTICKSLTSFTWTCTYKSGAFITFGHHHPTDFTFEHMFTSGHYSACKTEKISCPLEPRLPPGLLLKLQNCFPLDLYSHLSKSTPQFKRKRYYQVRLFEVKYPVIVALVSRQEQKQLEPNAKDSKPADQ